MTSYNGMHYALTRYSDKFQVEGSHKLGFVTQLNRIHSLKNCKSSTTTKCNLIYA